jgi:hypothetical protein
MPKDIGVEPVPDDEIEKWLKAKLSIAEEEAQKLASEFKEVIEMGEQKGDPEIFAYARLLNHLAELESPALLRILSAYVWFNQKGE